MYASPIRLLTGHGLFKSHCKNIGVGSDANCSNVEAPPLGTSIPGEGTTCGFRSRRATQVCNQSRTSSLGESQETRSYNDPRQVGSVSLGVKNTHPSIIIIIIINNREYCCIEKSGESSKFCTADSIID
ncbi:hypothetical protein PV325_006951, partial [Microctonus aethiopoides]